MPCSSQLFMTKKNQIKWKQKGNIVVIIDLVTVFDVAYENRSDPCGCWCAWYSEEGYGRKHQESIRESYYDRDSKDLHTGICANPQKSAQCMNRMIDLSD